MPITLQFLKDSLTIKLAEVKALRNQIADHPDTKRKPVAKKPASNVKTTKPARTSKAMKTK